MDALLAPPLRGFTSTEYERRCAAIQSRMRSSGIDLLWLTTEADVRYVTGFFTQFWQSPTRPWNILLPQHGKPHGVIPSIGEYCMRNNTWIDDALQMWSSPQPDDEGVTLLADSIQALTHNNAVIGLPMGSETHLRYPLKCWTELQSLLPHCTWVDATDVIRPVRQVKSPAEIDKLRYVCQAASLAFAEVPKRVKPGMTEIDVFRSFRIACLEAGADEAKYLVGAARPQGYEDVISSPGHHPLDSGDILMLDVGCIYDGYYSDFDRNFAIAKSDTKTASAHQRVWDATEAGLALIKPGARCCDIFHAMQTVMQGNKATSVDSGVGRLGHGLGTELTETPSIAPFDETLLQPGMAITLEPGYNYDNEKIMVHEENLVVTNTGYELLSRRASRDIPVI